MRIYPIKIILLALTYSTLTANQAHPDNSLIQTIINAKKSIVRIQAIQIDIKKNPKNTVTLDQKTGKLFMSQKVIATHQQKHGAGVILTSSGLIATNVHTIAFSQKITVKTFNNTTYWAKVVHLDPSNDLALLKINAPEPLVPIHIANSNYVNIGDIIAHVGNTGLWKETISEGKISGLAINKPQANKKLKQVELIETNLDLSKGASGGPILNLEGQLIGIIMGKLDTKKPTSFAIPSNKIKKLYLNFIK